MWTNQSRIDLKTMWLIDLNSQQKRSIDFTSWSRLVWDYTSINYKDWTVYISADEICSLYEVGYILIFTYVCKGTARIFH